VLDYIHKSQTEITLVATSDHETGGLSTALQEPGHLPVYNWYPQALARVNASAERLHHLLNEHINSDGNEGLRDWVNQELVVARLGIANAREDELDLLVSHPEIAVETFADSKLPQPNVLLLGMVQILTKNPFSDQSESARWLEYAWSLGY
jgi:alkaline phosphatase